MTTDDTQTTSSPITRVLLLWCTPIVLILAVVAYYWLTRHTVSTDNAYVRAEKTAVSAEVEGRILQVLVGENQRVEQGQLIIQLDDRDQRLAVQQAEAEVNAVRADIESLKAAYGLHQTRMEVARNQAHYSQNEFERQKKMASDNMASQSELDEAEQKYQLMRGAGLVLQQQMKETLAKLGGDPDLPVDQHPRVQTALAQLQHAQLQLQRTQLAAPRSGIVSQLPYAGGFITLRVPAFYVVDEQHPWIEANFKETELGRLRPGQPVEIEIDSYPDHTWHGRIDSIAQASGAEFAILPPQNATGNWVKVVQRIPVRIAIDEQGDTPTLRAGMSSIVSVDVAAP